MNIYERVVNGTKRQFQMTEVDAAKYGATLVESPKKDAPTKQRTAQNKQVKTEPAVEE